MPPNLRGVKIKCLNMMKFVVCINKIICRAVVKFNQHKCLDQTCCNCCNLLYEHCCGHQIDSNRYHFAIIEETIVNYKYHAAYTVVKLNMVENKKVIETAIWLTNWLSILVMFNKI